MTQCCICLEETSDEKDTAITVCGHNYHTSCLLKWISNSKNFCPLCRSKLVDQEILPEAPEPEPSPEPVMDILDRMLDGDVATAGYEGDDAYWPAN